MSETVETVEPGAAAAPADGGAPSGTPPGSLRDPAREPGSAPAASSPPAAAAPDFYYKVEARPDFVPETFFEADKGISVEKLAKSYRELQGRFGQKNDALKAELLKELRKDTPATPEDFALEFDASLLPEGYTAKDIPSDDPMLKAARTVLHRLGGTQADMKELAGAFIQWQTSAIPSIAAEKAKLGEGADERIAQVDAWLARSLPEKHYASLMGAVQTAGALEAIEAIMRRATGGGIPAGTGGVGAAAALPMTPQEAMQIVSDPAYNTPAGAELRAKFSAFVRAGGRLPGYRGAPS
jgi:hypothetical protein